MAQIIGPPPPPPPTGLPGPPGPQGPSGLNGGVFVWEQLTASDTWGPIPHNLGFPPAVSVRDSAGTAVDGEVHHLDANTTLLTFAVAFGGSVTFS